MRVVFTRGGLPESEHPVIWCAAEADTAVVQTSEQAPGDLAIFARSATKPLQALPAVQAGVLERYGLDDRHLAVGCASHGGGPEHLRAVREILDACGLGEEHLRCGPLAPRDPAVELDGPPSRIVHNCSGKHALGLALCVMKEWPLEGYLAPEHPLQRAMREAVADATCAYAGDVVHGTDGCGMATFRVPLGALARAFGRLAGGALGASGDRVARAMSGHPQLVAFGGAVDTELMRASDGLVAKAGAEGVLAVGLPDGRGLALKVRDGAMRALDPAAVAAVRSVLGVEVELPDLARPAVLNSLGERVGEGVVEL